MSDLDQKTKTKITEASKAIVDNIKTEFDNAVKKFNIEGRVLALVSECVEREVEKAKKLL